MNNIRKEISIKKDELFLENINQITPTGWNINYNRSLLTDLQIQELCIDENTLNQQKFIKLLKNGQKIQKYSVLQNMSKYWSIKNKKSFCIILCQIQKLCLSEPQYLAVIGQGLVEFFKKQLKQNITFYKQLLDLKTVKLMRNILEIVYTNSKLKQMDDWNIILQRFIDFSYQSIKISENTLCNADIKEQITKLIESLKIFINTSFSMSALPQKRRTGFHILNSLYNSLEVIREIALSKVIFFNDDSNQNTRQIIAEIIIKILNNNYLSSQQFFNTRELRISQQFLTSQQLPSPQQLKAFSFPISQVKDIFQIIKNYLFDLNQNIAKNSCTAFILMEQTSLLSIQQKKQFLGVFFSQLVELKTDQNKNLSFLNILKKILVQKGLCDIIKFEKLMKTKIFCFINKHLKAIGGSTQPFTKQNELMFQKIFSIYQSQIFNAGGLTQIQFISQVQLHKLNLNKFSVFLSYCSLYKQTQNIQFKENVKKQFLKAFKNNKDWNFSLLKDNNGIKYFLQVLDQDNIQHQNIIIQTLQKLFQNSKWNLLLNIFQLIKTKVFAINNVQKLNLHMLKIVLSCPFYMMPNCFQVIIHLLFLNNKNPQLLNIIKQKLMKSKNWIHRRSYFLLYCFIKQKTSFQIHKLIASLNSFRIQTYFRLTNIKNLVFYYLFIRFIDPANKIQKAIIHQTISQLLNQQISQDYQLRQKYLKCKKKLHQIDSNVQKAFECYQQNKILLKKQYQLTNQVNAKKQQYLGTKKIIKTQKSIKSQQNEKKSILGNLKKSFDLKNNSKQILKYTNVGRQIQLQKPSENMLLRQNQFPNKRNSALNLGKISLSHLGKQNVQKQGNQQMNLIQHKLKNQNGFKRLRQNKSAFINIRKKQNSIKL